MRPMPFSSPKIEAAAECLSCGHSLAGLMKPRCPECGRAFEFNDPSSWKRRGDLSRLLKALGSPPGPAFITLAVVFGVLTVGASSRMLMSIQNWLFAVIPFALLVLIWALRASAWRLAKRARPADDVDRGLGSRRWLWFSVWMLIAVALSCSGLARWVRWRYDEPRMRAEAMRVLSNPPPGPPPEFSRSEKSVGTLVIWRAFVENGRVHLSTRQTDGMFNFAELVYSPPGAAPPPWSTDLGGGWSVLETSTVH